MSAGAEGDSMLSVDRADSDETAAHWSRRLTPRWLCMVCVWRVKGSNLRSFRGGFTVRRARMRLPGFLRAVAAPLSRR